MEDKYLKRAHGVPGAIVNTDNKGLAAYRKARADMIKHNQEYQALKSDVAEMKLMLSSILEKLK